MDQYTQLLVYLAGPAIAGLVVWIWSLHKELNNFKIEVANRYVRNAAIDELRQDMKEMNKTLWEIAGKLGVPIRKE